MRLFISYAHIDVAQVKELVDILRAGGHDPWFDHKLLPGQDWQAELLAAITTSDAFVYALTPDSTASEWCQWEFARAVEMGKPVIPVMIRKIKAIPKEISRFQYADVSEGFTPFNIAQVMGGLTHIATFRVQTVPVAPTNPSDMPAQAVGTGHVVSTKKPPDLSHILPPPYEWCEIPAGWVTLKDVGMRNPRGGKFPVNHFWVSKYPITNAQFEQFVYAKDGYTDLDWWLPKEFANDWREMRTDYFNTAHAGHDLPRTNVSWYEAMGFCGWLSAQVAHMKNESPENTTYNITLPSEQQWQWAAQGGDERLYPWGNEFDESKCNTHGRIGRPNIVTKYVNGSSPFGVMDLIGNVLEWCADNTGGEFSYRGGGWNARLGSERVDYRLHVGKPDIRDHDLGFRVVCVVN